MKAELSWAERLAPNCILRLERAALSRFEAAEELRPRKRLQAVYLYGYCAEMYLGSAYFRSAGFSPTSPIDDETRKRHMLQAKKLKSPAGSPLMNSDAHPLVGWARFLEWKRSANPFLSELDRQLLKSAINKAVVIYDSWRPEVRYKTDDFSLLRVESVRLACRWFIENHKSL